jgi:hypothetical protein
MELKHTTGKWTVCNGANFLPSIGNTTTHKGIADIIRQNDTDRFCEEAQSNARLIASAPEMLSSLITAYNFLWIGNQENTIVAKQILETIQKATGQKDITNYGAIVIEESQFNF